MSLPVALAQTSNLVVRPEASVALQLDGDREGDREGDGSEDPAGAAADTDADANGTAVEGGAASCQWSQSILGPRHSMQSRAHIMGPTHIRDLSEVVQAVICQPRDPNQGKFQS